MSPLLPPSLARFGRHSLLSSSFPRYTCKVNKTGDGRAAAAETGGRALSIIVTSSSAAAAAGGGKEISEEAEGGLDVSVSRVVEESGKFKCSARFKRLRAPRM